MFAGAASRAFRGESTSSRGVSSFFSAPHKKKDKDKFSCYVPFMWSSCLVVCGGLIVMVGGTAMCVADYYLNQFDNATEALNNTIGWRQSEHPSYLRLSALSYTGPVVMAMGCFAVIIACVVVCETRDKMLKIMEENSKRGWKTKTKPDFYHLVVENIKHGAHETRKLSLIRGGRKVDVTFEGDKGNDIKDPKRRKSFLGIVSTLRRLSLRSADPETSTALLDIPQNNPTRGKGPKTKRAASLIPVSYSKESDRSAGLVLPSPVSRPKEDLSLISKYPSASCIQDLLKLKEDRLATLFPDLPSLTHKEDVKVKEDTSVVSSVEKHATPRQRTVPHVYINDVSQQALYNVSVDSGSEQDISEDTDLITINETTKQQ